MSDKPNSMEPRFETTNVPGEVWLTAGDGTFYYVATNGTLLAYCPFADGPYVFCSEQARWMALLTVQQEGRYPCALYRDAEGRFYTDTPEHGGRPVSGPDEATLTHETLHAEWARNHPDEA